MDNLHDTMNFDSAKFDQEELQRDEMKEFDRLSRQERDIKEAFYSKRQQKEQLKRTGGAKSESPIWKDTDRDD